jgi:hypothetical protein
MKTTENKYIQRGSAAVYDSMREVNHVWFEPKMGSFMSRNHARARDSTWAEASGSTCASRRR